jgi:hypothetical protein
MCLLPSRAKDIYAHESDAELTSLMDRLVMRASVIAGQDPQLMYGPDLHSPHSLPYVLCVRGPYNSQLKNKYTLMCRGAETKWSQIAYDTTLLALAHHVTRDPDISLALARRMTEIFAGRGPGTGMLDNKLYTRGSVSRYRTMWHPLPYCRSTFYVTKGPWLPMQSKA